jgi:hypothetical protein
VEFCPAGQNKNSRFPIFEPRSGGPPNLLFIIYYLLFERKVGRIL